MTFEESLELVPSEQLTDHQRLFEARSLYNTCRPLRVSVKDREFLCGIGRCFNFGLKTRISAKQLDWLRGLALKYHEQLLKKEERAV